jgi:hypothetical protein
MYLHVERPFIGKGLFLERDDPEQEINDAQNGDILCI